MLTTFDVLFVNTGGSVLVIILIQSFDLHFMYQGAEETEVCGDGAGTRCAGSADQRHEHTAESASHASGTLAADSVKGASMCKKHPLFLVSLHPLPVPCMHESTVVCRQTQQ